MRSKFLFLLAIIMAIITTFLFFNNTQQPPQTEQVAQQSTVKVIVAKQPITENQLISADMLEEKQVVDENVLPQAVSSIAEVEGKFATGTIESEEIILSHHLTDAQEENLFLSRKVKEGFRAVSISVSDIQSVANLIEPNDYVDVNLTKGDLFKEGQDSTVISEIILSNVHVLAVGKKMVESTTVADQIDYNTITFELTPSDANTLIKATLEGTLHLTLHSRINSDNPSEQ
ncbi:Flp pilus assembly protein CpaB [Radiobacillus sp. PE A8.2]|uniref:Flp pilus assembly protein CpaB n=1 Tax=Radiobacillus sp. PE A8.2 TaxID=3380349 RepID=UPI0038910B53